MKRAYAEPFTERRK